MMEEWNNTESQKVRNSKFERKFTFLKFLLDYPVRLDKQFSPEAIPSSAIDEFLAATADE